MKRLHNVLVLVVLTTLMAGVTTVTTPPLHAAATDDFVITIKTDNLGWSTNTQFTIPTIGGGYNYNVDCDNDGTNDATAQTGAYTCNYGAAGTYTVRIQDNSGAGTGFPQIYFNNTGDRPKLLTIEQWGSGKWASMNSAFAGCNNLAGQASDSPDLSNVTDMSYMFAYTGAFNQNIENWNTANVTNMSGMFAYAVFNQNIGSWNTANVTDMSEMFSNATFFNQPIGNWNTANVTNMSGMFSSALSFNQPIGSWNTAKVTDMPDMFYRAIAFNQNIGNWDTANVTNMSGMFARADVFNENIGSWNTANVADMSYMFAHANAFNQPIGIWNTANVKNMSSMFSGASSFNQNIGSWNTANVSDMKAMFADATAFNQPIESWNTANVTDMRSMFIGATAFNQPIQSWNTAKVTNMDTMFLDASVFNQNLGGWNVSVLGSATNMFYGATLSTVNYDALLNGWDAQTLQSGVYFDGGNSHYCDSEAARTNMVASDNWIIFDAGRLCPATVDVTGVKAQMALIGGVVVKWKSVTEAQIAGYNVYRKLGKGVWTKGNTQLKPAKNSGEAVGAKYSLKDKSIKHGKTYWYLIEVVYLDGHHEWTRSVKIKVP